MTPETYAAPAALQSPLIGSVAPQRHDRDRPTRRHERSFYAGCGTWSVSVVAARVHAATYQAPDPVCPILGMSGSAPVRFD
jgi:hypothetical protein